MKLRSHFVPGASGGASLKTNRTAPALLAGATAVVLVAGGASVVMAANPPIGPGNIEIFPNRDMVAIDGYTDQAGEEATITVTRAGSLIGIARGVVDVNGFLEVNHAGSACWDVVTPNIQGGDVVKVEFPDGSGDGANTATAAIASVESKDLAATPEARDVEAQIVIRGTYGADVSTERMVVEIVNADMRDTPIGERAIGWPTDEPPSTYTVNGETDNGTFAVTYGFFSAAERDVALAGSPAVLSWQAEPVGVEAQLGLTLAEFNEINGPGAPECPPGPGGQAPNAPTNAFATSTGGGSITATWEPATVPTDAPAITGYRITAYDTELNQEVSTKVGAAATKAAIRGLVDGQSYPVTVVALNGQASAEASGGTVTVTAGEAPVAARPSAPEDVAVDNGSLAGSADITWSAAAANGSAVTGYRVDATTGSGPAGSATVGGGATAATIEGLTPGTEYEFVVTALSAAGDSSAAPVTFGLAAADLKAPAAPNVVRVVAGNGSATVEWQPAAAANTPVTGYLLTAKPATGTAVVVETDAAARSAVLRGLTNGTTYALELVATSAGGNSSPATFGSGATASVTPADQLTATAEFRADKREWRIGGSASVTAGNTITARNANGAFIGSATVLADGSWTIRVRNSAAPSTPTVTITSSAGGSITVPASTR